MNRHKLFLVRQPLAVSMAPLPPASLQALRAAVVALKDDPQLLHDASLGFFSDYLRSLGATLPPAAAAHTQSTSNGGDAAKTASTSDSSNADLRDEECVKEPDVASQSVDFAAKEEPSDSDLEKASAAKAAAADAIANGDFETAMKQFTLALEVRPDK